MFNLTPAQVAEIINDPDLTSVDKINKLSRYFTIDPTTCTPDRVYHVKIKDSGRETTGWRGGGRASQWCVRTITGAMQWNKDDELNVLGEVTRTAEKTYRSVDDMVADGAGAGTTYRDKDAEQGEITGVVTIGTLTHCFTNGNAGATVENGPYTITEWVEA